MSIAESLLPEFEQEMAAARWVLERAPGDKALDKAKPAIADSPMAGSQFQPEVAAATSPSVSDRAP